ncbi:hypothetical protein MRX96_015544 [Rhipicephalus microplus]
MGKGDIKRGSKENCTDASHSTPKIPGCIICYRNQQLRAGSQRPTCRKDERDDPEAECVDTARTVGSLAKAFLPAFFFSVLGTQEILSILSAISRVEQKRRLRRGEAMPPGQSRKYGKNGRTKKRVYVASAFSRSWLSYGNAFALGRRRSTGVYNTMRRPVATAR